MALLSLVRNDGALLEKAGEQAGICHARSAVFYLLSVLSRIDNTLLAQGSDVGAIAERTEWCFCYQSPVCGQKTQLLFGYRKLWSCLCK